MIRLFLSVLLILATGCEYEEVTRETGYKGKARINPWLAAERFALQKGHTVRSLNAWKNPDWNDSICFIPAVILNNEGFVRNMESWVQDGGHLVLLVDHAESDRDDWRTFYRDTNRVEPALIHFLKKAGIELDIGRSGGATSKIVFDEKTFEVKLDSFSSIKTAEGDHRVFAHEDLGAGQISVVTDSRIFRNRWISDLDHAALLNALIDSSEYDGSVCFIRGSGFSLWDLLKQHLWPFLIALSILLVIWLWKNFSRFGPLESAQISSPLRGYDHHLEALGDFQWRLDRGAALLSPLREKIVEGGQRMATKSGRRDDDFFQVLADSAGLPRDRVVRALTEAAPSDAAVMTRTAADLQRLLTVI